MCVDLKKRAILLRQLSGLYHGFGGRGSHVDADRYALAGDLFKLIFDECENVVRDEFLASSFHYLLRSLHRRLVEAVSAQHVKPGVLALLEKSAVGDTGHGCHGDRVLELEVAQLEIIEIRHFPHQILFRSICTRCKKNFLVDGFRGAPGRPCSKKAPLSHDTVRLCRRPLRSF